MNKQFKRNIENFTCENCGVRIIGNGYTNHCTCCLWSKHVDINPGDRACSCKALMEPIFVEKKGEEIILSHKCLGCGKIKKNKISDNDNFEEILELMN